MSVFLDVLHETLEDMRRTATEAIIAFSNPLRLPRLYGTKEGLTLITGEGSKKCPLVPTQFPVGLSTDDLIEHGVQGAPRWPANIWCGS